MYVEMISGGQPFTAGRVCFFKKMSFAPWVQLRQNDSPDFLFIFDHHLRQVNCRRSFPRQIILHYAAID